MYWARDRLLYTTSRSAGAVIIPEQDYLPADQTRGVLSCTVLLNPVVKVNNFYWLRGFQVEYINYTRYMLVNTLCGGEKRQLGAFYCCCWYAAYVLHYSHRLSFH